MRDAFLRLEVSVADIERWEARLRLVELGPVRLTELRTSASSFTRSEADVRHEAPASAQFVLVHTGTVTLVQRDRTARLGPGDVGLVEPLHPCLVEFSDDCRSFALEVPRSLIALPTAELIDLVAIRITADGAMNSFQRLTAELIEEVLDGDERLDVTQRVALGSAFVGLMTVLVSAIRRVGAAVTPGLLEDVKAYIERNLGDPDLTPGTIAAAHHISLRYLHRLFDAEPQTVASHVRSHRLEAVRRDLGNPALAHLTVAEIGARWGLLDGSHLSQAFRRAYGTSPGRYRAASALR